MTEVLVLLIALFMGPDEGNFGDGFMLYTNTFPDKESCNQYIIENQDWLQGYLTDRWGTSMDVNESELHCMTSDEIKKYFVPKSGKKIDI